MLVSLPQDLFSHITDVLLREELRAAVLLLSCNSETRGMCIRSHIQNRLLKWTMTGRVFYTHKNEPSYCAPVNTALTTSTPLWAAGEQIPEGRWEWTVTVHTSTTPRVDIGVYDADAGLAWALWLPHGGVYLRRKVLKLGPDAYSSIPRLPTEKECIIVCPEFIDVCVDVCIRVVVRVDTHLGTLAFSVNGMPYRIAVTNLPVQSIRPWVRVATTMHQVVSVEVENDCKRSW